MITEFDGHIFNNTPAYPSDGINPEMAKAILHIKTSLENIKQLGFLQLVTGLNNVGSHPNPEIRRAIQSNVDEMKEGLCVVYIFSIWESYCESLMREFGKDPLDDWMTDSEKHLFRAYEHIRHSIAHGFGGKRANNDRAYFEAIMNSNNPINGVRFNQENDTIDLIAGGVALSYLEFMTNLSTKLFGRIANNRKDFS